MRYLIALLVASSLLAACTFESVPPHDFGDVDVESDLGRNASEPPATPSAEQAEKQRLHELRVACLTGGREWDASTETCVTPPTPTREPTATATPQPTATREPTATPTPSPTPSTFELLSSSVVRISTDTGCGSGFAVGDQGHIATAWHVVEGADGIEVQLPDGSTVEAEVVAGDINQDLALLALTANLSGFLTPVRWGDSAALAPGAQLDALGFPVTLTNTFSVACSDSLTVTSGGLSATQTILGLEYLQTDATTNKGNSGGPVVTSDGAVVGVVRLGLHVSVGENTNYLIPEARVRPIIESWLKLLATGVDLMPQITSTPTARPIPAQVVEWKEAFNEFADRRSANVDAHNDLQDRIGASGGDPEPYLDEIKDQRDEFRSAEGAYGLRNKLPRFPEVRVLNDRIDAWTESVLTQKNLYIRYLETNDSALFDQSQELRIATNVEWRAIVDAANDFLRPYGLNRD